ncbi:MAG: cobalt ECF transporter T component CbiQ [Gemmataceae bacterium]|nr:cobalt ECF transporter T component CbiQ [Gemmataceae bacterium]
MTLAIDLPECPESFVQRLDARWRLSAIVLACLACAPIRSSGPALAALVGAAILVAIVRLPWRWIVYRLGTAMIFFTVFLVWLPFAVAPGDYTLDLTIVTISLEGSLRLVALTAKLCAMTALVLVLIATVPLHETLHAAQALRIPGVLIHVTLLTYRYVFLLIDEFHRLRTALRVRGFRNRADSHSYRTIGQVAGTLLVRGHERSERVAQAMRCRGFAGEFHSLREYRTTAVDMLAFAVIVSYSVGLLVWDWLTST